MADGPEIGHCFVMRCGIGIFDPVWLEHRAKLLRATMGPSLKAQTCTSFNVMVFVDERHPGWFLDSVKSAMDGVPGVELVGLELLRDVREEHQRVMDRLAKKHGYAYTISSRIDDDDALTRNAVARIQESAGALVSEKEDAAAVAIGDGIRYAPIADVGAWERHASLGVGLSIVAKRGDPAGNIFSVKHRQIGARFEESGRRIRWLTEDDAAWLNVVHKLSDSKFERKVERKIRQAADPVKCTSQVLQRFGVDVDALEDWLCLERRVDPIKGEKLTERVRAVEKEIAALRAKPGSGRRAIEELHRKRCDLSRGIAE